MKTSREPEKPKYPDPINEITDLAAARVISFFLSTLNAIDECVRKEFQIVERINKAESSGVEARLGYQSVHYLVTLKPNRTSLPEYSRFAGLKAEIQARTILQHAWAEIEHDIQYKSLDVLPQEIRRRFLALAGMLEIGDREFQAISDAHSAVQREARESVEAGRFSEVEITPDSLKAYLDKRLGPDGRMREWSYEWTTRMLKQLRFTNLAQIEEAIGDYDDDRISRVLHGQRQGQLSRFDDVLLASMGDEFIERHPFNLHGASWWSETGQERLQRLRNFGIAVGTYTPGDPGSDETD